VNFGLTRPSLPSPVLSGVAGIHIEVEDISAQAERRPEHARPFDFALTEHAEHRLADGIGTNRCHALPPDRLVQSGVADVVVAKLDAARVLHVSIEKVAQAAVRRSSSDNPYGGPPARPDRR
jgi:hypothetical protein